MIDYDKRLVEVDEILDLLPQDDLSKIPEDIREMIKDNKNKEYEWKFDKEKELKDQELNRDTIVILSYLNMKYLLNKEQKELMGKIYKLNEVKAEKIKEEKYKADDLFKDNNIETDNQNTQMILYKENIFMKLFKRIKNLFKLKNQI